MQATHHINKISAPVVSRRVLLPYAQHPGSKPECVMSGILCDARRSRPQPCCRQALQHSCAFSLQVLWQWLQQSKLANAAAGQQESKIESLESIHAARLRSGSEAGTSAPQTGLSVAALTAKSHSASDSEADDQAVLGNGGLGEADAETDPYSLPVSHEVALEGVCVSACACVRACVCVCASVYLSLLAAVPALAWCV